MLVRQMGTCRLDDIPALFGSLLHLAGQKQTATGRHKSWKTFKRMKHVEAMKVDHSRGNGVVTQTHFSATGHNEASSLLAIAMFCVIRYAILDAGCVLG